jgi:hypothetical protein
MFCGKIGCLFIVTTLPTHGYRSVQIKFKITRRLDKFFKLINVFELCIAVQKERGMICSGLVMFMQFLEVLNQVVYSLGVEELNLSVGNTDEIRQFYLSNNLGWFGVVNRFQILLHSTVIV